LEFLIKIEDEKYSEQGMNHWSQSSPMVRQRFMDDILHLMKAYNVVEVQFHLLLTLALDGDVRLRSVPL
jgi:hypothetical protein